uniref:hypothetical protein n=1 Tax=Orrella sp. TaxID=1921583 RepID=UPI004047E91A
MTQPTTMGLVFETKYLDNAKAAIKNIDALAAIKLAQETKAFGIVLAGQLHKKDAGCIAMILPEESLVKDCAAAAHARLGEIGSRQTAWMVKLEDKAIERSVLAALKEVQ